MLRLIPHLIFLGTIPCVICFLVPDGKVSVKTNVGEIVGYSTTKEINGSQKVLHEFLAIPYAKPPTGARRFRKPEPMPPFKTPHDASAFGPICHQLKLPLTASIVENFTQSEDCLYLNIFAPGRLAGDNHLYPTMIFVHGGGFVIGSSNGYDPSTLSLSGEVVVVTVNYRLNVFGFLSTHDNDTRGNMGLFDQHLAIRWVHDIQAFGGDPNRVTIFGESAGSASVGYQIIYPGNKGLVHRAISESGSFSSPWAFINDDVAQDQTRKLATAVNCSYGDTNFIKCLQAKPASVLETALQRIARNNNYQTIFSAPVVDNEFVLDDPKKIITDSFPSQREEEMFRGVDLIIGVNNKEGLVQFPPYNESSRLDFNKSYIDDTLIPAMIGAYTSYNGSSTKTIKDAVILEYTDWENVTDNRGQFSRLVDLVTDLSFHVPAAQTASSHASNSTGHTYVYLLSAKPHTHLLPVYKEIDGPSVANHGDDLGYIFDYGANVISTAEQRRLKQAIVTMWSNFAKTG